MAKKEKEKEEKKKKKERKKKEKSQKFPILGKLTQSSSQNLTKLNQNTNLKKIPSTNWLFL